MNVDYNMLGYAIFKILQDYSSPDNPLKQLEIMKHLKDEYELTPARGTLSKTIHQLYSTNCPIRGIQEDKNDHGSRNGIWLDPELSEVEINMLAGPIVTASHYSNENIDKLLNILNKLGHKSKIPLNDNKYKSEHFYHCKGDLIKTSNLIHRAITNGTKICFTYGDMNEKKELIPRCDEAHPDGKRNVSVYGYACMDNHYYMVACENDGKRRNYRIDKMINVMITGQKAELNDKYLSEAGTFDAATYVSEQNYKMFVGRTTSVKFRITTNNAEDCNRYINIIWDEFGNKVRRIKKIDNKNFEFTASLPWEGAKIFARQYCTVCEVLSPEDMRKELIADFRKAEKKLK